MKIRIYTKSSKKEVSGGLKQMYRLADVLGMLGYDAAMLVESGGEGQAWFNNKTRMVKAHEEVLEKGDILIVGEQARGIPDVPGVENAFIVVYAQNPYGVVPGMGHNVVASLKKYRDRVGMVWCVSEHSRELLSWMLDVEVSRVRYSFDREPFGFCGEKERLISMMPRKSGHEMQASIILLNVMGKMNGWRAVSIHNMSEAEVADVLKRSAIFMSGSRLEGFGMPPAEAMACGCVVVGYDGIAGVEFMDPSVSLTVRTGDMLGMAKAVDSVISMNMAERSVMGAAASGMIRTTYSTEREIESVKQAMKRVEELI